MKKTTLKTTIISAFLITLAVGIQAFEVAKANFAMVPDNVIIAVQSPQNKTYIVNNLFINFTVECNYYYQTSYVLDAAEPVTIQPTVISRKPMYDGITNYTRYTEQGNATLANLSEGKHTLAVQKYIIYTWEPQPIIINSTTVSFNVNTQNSPTPTPTSKPAVTVSLSESASALNYGNTINFTVSADGGIPPYTFTWHVDSQMAETSVSPYFSIDSLAVGSHFVDVQVNDANNNSANTDTVSFEVLPVSSTSPILSPTPTSFPSPSLSFSPSVSFSPSNSPQLIADPAFPLPATLLFSSVAVTAIAIVTVIVVAKKKHK